ncbi:MAG: hypothetical protein JNM17_38435 [Archangium sp.]|nr:hypothetical protein [Archangium sp.]
MQFLAVLGQYRPVPNDFERAAAGGGSPSALRDWLDYLKRSGKWWLVPVLIVLAVLAALALLTASPAAPFIYTLF